IRLGDGERSLAARDPQKGEPSDRHGNRAVSEQGQAMRQLMPERHDAPSAGVNANGPPAVDPWSIAGGPASMAEIRCSPVALRNPSTPPVGCGMRDPERAEVSSACG